MQALEHALGGVRGEPVSAPPAPLWGTAAEPPPNLRVTSGTSEAEGSGWEGRAFWDRTRAHFSLFQSVLLCCLKALQRPPHGRSARSRAACSHHGHPRAHRPVPSSGCGPPDVPAGSCSFTHAHTGTLPPACEPDSTYPGIASLWFQEVETARVLFPRG